MSTAHGLLHTSADHKLVVGVAAGTTAPPAGAGAGAAFPSSWNVRGSARVRRAMLRLTAAAAMNATAISVWVYVDGVWSRHSTLSDVTFTAAILSVLVPIEWPVGDRIALAYTVSASTMAVDAFPLETCE